MNIKTALIFCVVSCFCGEKAANAILKSVEEVEASIVRKLPPTLSRLSPEEVSVLRFAVCGEPDFSVPWKHPSYDHIRTLVFLDELARFYTDEEAVRIRPRLSHLLYADQSTPYCESCLRTFLGTQFQTLLPQGEEGFSVFLDFFQTNSLRKLPGVVDTFVHENCESVVHQAAFPRTLQELDFISGIYFALSAEAKTALRSAIDEETFFMRTFVLGDNQSAVPYPLALYTERFLEEVLQPNHYKAFYRRQRALQEEMKQVKWEHLLTLLGEVSEKLGDRRESAFRAVIGSNRGGTRIPPLQHLAPPEDDSLLALLGEGGSSSATGKR